MSPVTTSKAHYRRIKLWDRAARWFIVFGGLGIIACVVAILAMIVDVSLPLFFPAQARPLTMQPLPITPSPNATWVATGLGEYVDSFYTLDSAGHLTFREAPGGSIQREEQLAAPGAPGATILHADAAGKSLHALLWSDGSMSIERLSYAPTFDAEGKRTIEPRVERVAAYPAEGDVPRLAQARVSEQGATTRVMLAADGAIKVVKLTETENFLGEKESSEVQGLIPALASETITALALDAAGKTLYAGTDKGHLVRWNIEDPESARQIETVQAFADGRAITALTLVQGDISLAVGDAKGGLSTWFQAPYSGGTGGERVLTKIHVLTPHDSPVVSIIPSFRDKTLLSLGADGTLALDYMTSERHLLEIDPPSSPLFAALSPRGNGILSIGKDGHASVWELHNPHPEISLQTLFGKVWYESYPRPAYVWQSSAANDDFEPKLSLVPLIFGTFKGTFYALIFAVPLAILGALYTSQFMRPQLRRFVKPTVEIMAAIPSVVIGFLAALWLAPRIEGSVIGLFLWLLLLPAILMLSMVFWKMVEDQPALRRFTRGYEFLHLIPVIVLTTLVAVYAGPLIEKHLFGGSFSQWIYTTTNGATRYDQRNSIIIAFALGFAVIPIIFTIADDALSNIPRSLTAASLALGASRWQTAWRVVLPSASPGIFAATMIGFGRAVGETMIVLMATGNTPVMDGSPFNGMRTLSANIAVEIPESPVNGTLYRVLFLTAVLLFLMTFVLNTVAEVVRQRLRKKYGSV